MQTYREFLWCRRKLNTCSRCVFLVPGIVPFCQASHYRARLCPNFSVGKIHRQIQTSIYHGVWDYLLGKCLPHKTGNSSGRKVVILVPGTWPFSRIGGQLWDTPAAIWESGVEQTLNPGGQCWAESMDQTFLRGQRVNVIPKGLGPLGRTQAMSVMASANVSCRDNSVLIASPVVRPEKLADNQLSRAKSLVSF